MMVYLYMKRLYIAVLSATTMNEVYLLWMKYTYCEDYSMFNSNECLCQDAMCHYNHKNIIY
jgi:hypothetical protein